ncbi:MAG: hypothetical protein ACXABV_00585 [Candidatus Thorarchaeota archaeon]
MSTKRKWTLQVLVVLTLLAVSSPSQEFVSASHVRSGSATMSPGQVYGVTISEDEGNQVTLTCEADFRPMEFALIRLDGLQPDDFSDDTDLNLIPCLYHEIALWSEIYLEVQQTSDFLLFVRNVANITQEFRYEWVAVNPDEEMATVVVMIVAPLVTVGFCLFCGIVYKMRQEQLLRQDQPNDWT